MSNASIRKDSKGNWISQFTTPEGTRATVRIGRIGDHQAQSWLACVKAIQEFHANGQPVDVGTQVWASLFGERLYDRLAEEGMIPPRTAGDKQPDPTKLRTLAGWIDFYLANLATTVKPSTIISCQQARRNLVDFFGADALLSDITPYDMKQYAGHLRTKAGVSGKRHKDGLAEATARRRTGRARQFFAAAVEHRILLTNPASKLKVTVGANRERQHYVSPSETERLIEAAPDLQWKLIIALARYGGLRCPSEVLALTWADIDWNSARFTVHAAKTAHLDGGGIRHVPLFDEIRPHLQAAYDQAEEGEAHVITRYREATQNVRTTFLKIILRAGLKPWPRLFQNLRSSCQTDLANADGIGIHKVCEWIGNSFKVARKHYLQVTPDDYHRAAGFRRAAQGAASGPGTATAAQTSAGKGHQNAAFPADVADPWPGRDSKLSLDSNGLRPETAPALHGALQTTSLKEALADAAAILTPAEKAELIRVLLEGH